MKRKSLVILTAVTSVLTANIQGALRASASETVPLTNRPPLYIGQASVQQRSSDRTSSNPGQESGSTVPLVLGLLVLLAIGAGAWVLRSRSRTQAPPTEDPQPLVSDQETIPVIAPQASFVEPEIITPQEIEDLPQEIIPVEDAQDLKEGIIPVEKVQDLPETSVIAEAAITPGSSELQLKLEALQVAIESAKQKFQNLSNNLEQEIAHQIQVLPESILSEPSLDLLSTQQKALEKLEVLQGVFLDLDLPADAYFKQGNALFNEQRYDDAIAHYDKAINLNSDSAFAWFNTALIYAVQGDIARSLRYLKQSIHLDPDCLNLVHKHTEFDVVREDLSFQELRKT